MTREISFRSTNDKIMFPSNNLSKIYVVEYLRQWIVIKYKFSNVDISDVPDTFCDNYIISDSNFTNKENYN